MSKIVNLKCEELRKYLNQFSDHVKNNAYNKINYSVWRQIISKAASEKECSIVVEPNHEVYIHFDHAHDYHVGYIFDISLGDFLSNIVIPEEEDKMNINNNLASTSTSTTSSAISYDEYCGYNPATIANPSNMTWSDGIGTVSLSNDFCRKSECPYNNKTEKENEKMNFNFDFGKVNADAVRMSPYGVAIKNRDGKWVSFNANTQEVIDVDGFNFNVGGMLWKMPVAVSAVQVGDVIVHNRKPMYVVATDNGIWAADIYEGEKKSIMPLTNMFGFNFVTKIVSIMDIGGAFKTGGDNTPTAENPFGGNFMQTMLMCQMLGDGGDMSDLFSGDMGKFMMLSMMTGGQNPFAAMFSGNK